MIQGLQIATVDGLKLRLTGEEVRALLEQKIDAHRRRAERWEREQARTPEEQTEEETLLPEHLCEHEATRYRWRVRHTLAISALLRVAQKPGDLALTIPELG